MSFHGQAIPALHGSTPLAGVLPVEIGFLERHGIHKDELRRGAALAASAGVSADDALLKAGIVAEERFYRALADELDLPFLAYVRVDGAARFPNNLLVGIAPLAPGSSARFVMAPAGTRLAWLVMDRRRFETGLAVTTPSALRRAVFESNAGPIADGAANELVRVAPQFSYKGGPSPGQILAGLGGLAGLVAATLAGWTSVAISAAVLSSIAFLAMVTMRIAAAFRFEPIEPDRPVPRCDDRDLPTYTVLVPLHRESRILRQLVAALTRFDYPAPKLDIKIVVEADDHETREAIACVSLPAFIEVIAVPPGEPRTKPRALNVALPLARGELTVVYDAEDRPDPGQLRQAASMFARLGPEVACLQGRLVIDNTADTWLTRLFTIEYAALFDVINPALAAWAFPVPLGGTSTHFRTNTLRGLQGWDAWNVTEDADLGIRLALEGYRVADLPSSTLEEAPGTVPAWMNQRIRWMKGFVQVSITHSRQPLATFRALGPIRFFAAAITMVGTVVAALAYPLCTIVSLDAFLGEALLGPFSIAGALPPAIAVVLFAAGWLAIMAPAVAGVCRRGWWTLLPWVPLMPFYYVLASVAAWCALVELVLKPSAWNKTEHGLARTSRAAGITGTGEVPRPPLRAGGRG